MIDPAIFRALVAQGASPEMLLAVVEADAAVREERLTKKRANNAERQQRHRERQRNERNALQRVTACDTPSFEVPPQTPPPNTNPEIIPPISPRAGGRAGKHRLPEDWGVPAVAELPPKAKSCAEQWTAASYETHGEAFVSYWRGNGKMMVDWRGTWANRVIALHSQVMRDQKFGNAPTGNAATGKPADPDSFRQSCAQFAENSRKMGREREALEWEAKARGDDPPRRTSTGPPRSIGSLANIITDRIQEHAA